MGGSGNHLGETLGDLGLEVGFDFEEFGEFAESPATVDLEVIHAGDPVDLHRGLLVLGLFAAVTLDLDDQVQQVVGATAIVDADDKVGEVLPAHAGMEVRHLEVEALVLHVGVDLRVVFGHAAEFRLPLAVVDDVVDVRTAGVGLPGAIGLGGIEVHRAAATERYPRVEYGEKGALALEGAGDAGGDTVASHVGELQVEQLSFVGVAVTFEMVVEPLRHDALELTEKMQFRGVAGVAILRLDEALGQAIDDRRVTDVLQVLDRHVGVLTDDPLVLGDRRADQVGRELQSGVFGEGGLQVVLGEIDAIALHAGELDFQGVALRRDRLHLDGRLRRLRYRDDRLGREIEGNTEDVGILDIVEPLGVEGIRLTTEGAADDLLTKELGAEGTDPQDVRDGIGVPAFGEHRDRHHATDAGA